ncbi:MAG TPA: hypothetical protein ENK10_09575 [Acidobacteria bacterium]|nr:hypothetical protein [Acidobacteriota bacterium]
MNNLPLLRRLALIASILIVTLVAAGLSAGARTLIERGDRAGVSLPASNLVPAHTTLASR